MFTQFLVETLESNSEESVSFLFDEPEGTYNLLDTLWYVSLPNDAQLVEQIVQTLQNTTSAAVVALLFMYARSRLSSRLYTLTEAQSEYSKSTAIMLDAFFTYIRDVPVTDILIERSIIDFSKSFRTNMIKQGIPYVGLVFSSSTVVNTKESAYQLLLNRALVATQVLSKDSDAVLEFLQNIDQMTDSMESALYQKFRMANEMLSDLTQRKFFFDFNIEDFYKVKKALPLVNKILSRSIPNDSIWSTFIDHFDGRFLVISRENPYEVFSLYREICGVLRGSTTDASFQATFNWLFRKHFEDTLNIIKIHIDQPDVLLAISQAWFQLSPSKKRGLNAKSWSCVGIELFKANVEIAEALFTCTEECDAKVYPVVKLMKSALAYKYANFGIMEMYNDTSVDKGFNLLFSAIQEWPFEEFSSTKKKLRIVLKAIDGVLDIKPSEVLKGDRYQMILLILQRSLLLPEPSAWKNACRCLMRLINLDGAFERFMPHHIILIDGLINLPHVPVSLFVRCLWTLVNVGRGETEQILRVVLSGFDGEHKDIINDISRRFMEDSQIELAVFQRAAEEFRSKMQKYSVYLSLVPEYVDIFRPH